MRFMVGASAVKSCAQLVALGTAYLTIAQQAMARDGTTPYPKMARSSTISWTELPRSSWRAPQRRSPLRSPTPRSTWRSS